MMQKVITAAIFSENLQNTALREMDTVSIYKARYIAWEYLAYDARRRASSSENLKR